MLSHQLVDITHHPQPKTIPQIEQVDQRWSMWGLLTGLIEE
jgi:hypothetical protein